MTIITGAVSDLLVGSPQLHCVISAALVALFEFLYLCPISRPSTDRSANTKYAILDSTLITNTIVSKYIPACLSPSVLDLSDLAASSN